MKQRDLLAHLDKEAIAHAIADAEKSCSGEIRVHVQPRLFGHDLATVAERTFERLGMTRTAARNGVLIFIAAKEQKFVVLGDRGIHEKVGPQFWEEIAGVMTDRFRSGQFTEGIVEAIRLAGSQLYAFFPPNIALILSNNSIFAPCLRMITLCCATDSELFQAQ